jgi:hypothetical protein
MMEKLLKFIGLVLYSGGFFAATLMYLDGYSYEEIIGPIAIYYVVLFVVSVFFVSWWDKRH